MKKRPDKLQALVNDMIRGIDKLGTTPLMYQPCKILAINFRARAAALGVKVIRPPQPYE